MDLVVYISLLLLKRSPEGVAMRCWGKASSRYFGSSPEVPRYARLMEYLITEKFIADEIVALTNRGRISLIKSSKP